MPQIIECPSGHRLKVPRKLAGHRIVCPVCNTGISVPPLTPPPQRETPAPTPTPTPTPTERTAQDASDQPTVTEKSTAEDRTGRQELAPATSTLTPPSREGSEERESQTDPDNTRNEFDAEPATAHATAQTPAKSPTPAESQTLAESQTPNSSTSDELHPEVDDDLADTSEAAKFDSPALQPFVSSGEAEFPNVASDDHNPGQPKLAELNHLQLDPIDPTSVFEEFIIVDDNYTSNAPVSVESASDFMRGQQHGAILLGLFAVVVAAICAVPAVVEHWNARQAGNPPDLWTFPVLLAALIQTGIAIFAMRVADWSTSWTATMVATFIAATYALGLALTMFASDEHSLVQQLGLLDEAYQRIAQPWCFFATCIALILAYAYGRFSIRWYRLDRHFASSR